jgi:SAM-dependent methyltransferase
MIQQRSASKATVIHGSAEDLPFDDKSFDASMAVLTIHHWSDQERGVMEMRRVTGGKIVFLTYDPSFRGFWLADYFPALVTLDEGQMPQMANYEKWLGSVEVSAVPIPHNCTDGFLAGYWRRPAAYLDERVRAAMSSFWALGDVSEELTKLEADLNSGAWEQRYSSLLDLKELDCGYRLVETK